MTKDESILCNLNKIKTKIKIGNGDFMEAAGKDTIAINTKRARDTLTMYS